MKKNDWILIVAAGLYSFLFYQQTAGINFVLFNTALIAFLVVKDRALLKKKNWWIAATGSLFSAFCIGYYGNALSVITNIISLSLLSALSSSDRSSVVFSLLFSFYSYCTSFLFIVLDLVARRKKETQSRSNGSFRKASLIIMPLLITLLFFFIYRASNPLFNNLAEKSDLDFISLDWVLFTFAGLILLYGFFYHRRIKIISDLDENASDDLYATTDSTITLLGKQLSINDEAFSGTVLLVLLNSLLLIVNALDINFMFIDGKLPQGLTYSEFVHQGIGMLIFSILIAILIILFYFRGALNFYEKNKIIKILAYLWIIQNAFMLVSTAFRNDLYISFYGITYKRIGVYIYLLLALLGLTTTLVKILKVKSNNYLFRINGWLFYCVLVVFCMFSWDKIITNYNIHESKLLDKKYLLELSDANLPQLLALQQDTTARNNEISLLKEDYQSVTKEDSIYPASYQDAYFETHLSARLYYFMKDRETLNWKSWYVDNSKIYNDLLELNKNKKIKTINLNNCRISSFKPLRAFDNIQEMYSGHNGIESIQELLFFTRLKKLNIQANGLISVKGIEMLENLEWLNISANPINDYSSIYKLKNLKELYVGVAITDCQYEELQQQLPNLHIIKL